MTDRGDRSVKVSRWLALVALVAINLVLGALVIEKQGLFGFGGDDPIDSVEPEAGEESGGPPPTEAETAATVGADDGGGDPPLGDDWPGGRPPVPDGPPEPRLALLDSSGRLAVGGSTPTWAVATEIVALAGARLPGGEGGVDNALTWHPDAPPQVGSGVVRLASPLLYDAGQIGVPEASTAALDVLAEVLSANPTVFAVIEAYVDDLGDSDENAAVAFARSNRVVDYVVAQGAHRDQLVIAAPAVGADGAASNDTVDGRAFNRRVEVRLEHFLAESADAR